MKKLLMSLALVGTFAAMSAKGADSYLYWMVDKAVPDTGADGTFSFATLTAVNKNDSSQNVELGAVAADSTGKSTARSLATSDGNLGYDVSGFTGENWSFVVELFNDKEEWLFQSELSYAEAYAMGGIFEQLAPSGAGAATFHTFSIPEPTSGLLMLIGLCGLALKRKRA